MNTWLAVIAGALSVFSWKFLGYVLPSKLLESAALRRFANYLTIALLAALVGVQTFTSGAKLEFDARIPSLLVAAILLRAKAPFIVIVIAAATTASLLRLVF